MYYRYPRPPPGSQGPFVIHHRVSAAAQPGPDYISIEQGEKASADANPGRAPPAAHQ